MPPHDLPPDLAALAAQRRYDTQLVAGNAWRIVRGLWLRVDRDDPAASWDARLGPTAGRVMRAAQVAAATGAQQYVSNALEIQGIDPADDGMVSTTPYVGVASDGDDLDGLLRVPVQGVEEATARGVSTELALAEGETRLKRMVLTQTGDAARVPVGVATVAARHVKGYIRMLTPPSCARCVILAGRWYKSNEGFKRHPNCLPAGVAVSGPAMLAATRRWYEGELAVITTASGQRLPITGNHPVLTDRGWLPANLIQEGDHVVRSVRGQGATSLVVPYEDQMPARIEDCWRTYAMDGFATVPSAAEDFHGDGREGQVDVVLADRLLWDWREAAFDQPRRELALTGGHVSAGAFDAGSSAQQLLVGASTAACGSTRGGSTRGGGLCGTGFAAYLGGAHFAGGRTVADFEATLLQTALDDVATDAVGRTQGVDTLAALVRNYQIIDRHGQLAARWDAPPGPFTVESRVAYVARGQDLRLRLAGQVELDRVVELRRGDWSGHVYNLTSIEGWYAANGLIVSNCDCVHVPASEDRGRHYTTDPHAYFDQLTADEQDRLFTKAGAQAIRDGADVFQVVNARLSMRSVEMAGRTLKATGIGVTRRSLAGQRLGAGRKRKVIRLMPESLYAISRGNRTELLRLLRLHGYII